MPELLARWWCRNAHGEPMHPINGKYICRKCQREYAVNWNIDPKPTTAKEPNCAEDLQRVPEIRIY